MTILGTRPEIIRLAPTIQRLDHLAKHILLHTGQNYDPDLSDVFFEQLEVRKPDVYMGVRGNDFADQIGQIIAGAKAAFERYRPERVLILGDTNSALAAITADRMGIPVYHMEAGNRCFDKRVPEEVNRRIVDHCSTILLPYTHRSKENLLREGISGERIYVTGNPINEVLLRCRSSIEASDALPRLGLAPQCYFLATFHRAENVDDEARLRGIVEGLARIHRRYALPVVCSVHPRTGEKIDRFGIRSEALTLLKPMNFFDFVSLERNAHCVLSDSGTVQEECCIFRVPTVTMRDVTERPETLDCGSNYLAGVAPEVIEEAVAATTALPRDWSPPPEYLEHNVSATVVRIVLGYARNNS